MIEVLSSIEKLEKVGFTSEQAKASVQLWLDFMDQDLNITHPIFEKNIHKQYLKKLEDNGFTPLQASSIFSIWSDIVGSYSTSPWQSSTNLT